MVFKAVQDMCFDDVRGKRILLAFSGGADSVALLHMLAKRQDEDEFILYAAHFHHGIRGDEADADAAFCRETCARLNVEYFEGHADVPALAQTMHTGIETAAREARYAFLRKIQVQVQADVIALAHHLDDQAETILMHILRGAGPEGACGMARLQDGLYRPLLGVRKAQLLEYLKETGISWREDQTNQISDTPRNVLRLNVLPEIEKCYPRAAEAIVRYGRLARIESDFMANAAEEFMQTRLETGAYGKRLMLSGNEDEALLRRAVRSIAGEFIGMEKMEEIISITKEKRGSTDVSGSLRIEKTPAALYFLLKPEKIIKEVPLNIPGETILPGICRITAEIGDFPLEEDNPRVEILDAEKLHGTVLRTRKSGDRIHPLGAEGNRLLSDYLTDKKIDRPLKNCMPLIACGSRILWACGAGMADDARITPYTRRKVRLEINPITDEKPEV